MFSAKQKMRGSPLLRPGQRGAAGGQVIATARPFGYFVAMTKYQPPRRMSGLR